MVNKKSQIEKIKRKKLKRNLYNQRKRKLKFLLFFSNKKDVFDFEYIYTIIQSSYIYLQGVIRFSLVE